MRNSIRILFTVLFVNLVFTQYNIWILSKAVDESNERITTLESHVQSYIDALHRIDGEVKELKQKQETARVAQIDVEINERVLLGEFKATAYDCGVASTGKKPGDKGYCITKDNVNLRGETRESAMTIAVDPRVIPLGSEVYLEFDEELRKYNGWYTASDTGSAIKGKRIDLFMGESAYKEAMKFGNKNIVKVYVEG